MKVVLDLRSGCKALLLAIVISVLALGSPSAATVRQPKVTESAFCDTITFSGVAHVFYRDGVRCRSAKYLARKVRRSGSRRPARGWRCTSGSNFTTGAYCKHRDGRLFGWHPFD